MTFNSFKTEIGRIGKVFGMEKYPEERLSILWRSLSRISDERFALVVDELIANQRTPPMLKEFAEAAAKIREPRSQHERSDEYKCIRCLDQGAYPERGEDGYQFARACVCESGQKFSDMVRKSRMK